MLVRFLIGNAGTVRQAVSIQCRRQIGVSAVVLQKGQKLEPVQQLYLNKLREYASKSKAADGAMFEVSPKTEKDMADEIDRLTKLYGGGDMTAFPEFKFKEVDFDAVAK
ncbi:ATP synthase peripheral stalk subunit F6, mitochondrial-like [Saccoglossus kowalevskii]|uniref:ATP synthase-coupling factor 6, mitochondrial n=1 Tax=Saccoglossus kowalevskii TaxID=10224 RepID=A0ABM0GUC4_SACKO|nr:PREDICTED: ATP synthase-coupling factor 6, mitochondrial-like isoform X1 [Saccoglossus kowalevskii]XP_006819911.1 PREDICTED: ATP synthase-coupling factor 6, mitochondrial-like isoform X2 [Saccoglossus kowalevskii]